MSELKGRKVVQIAMSQSQPKGGNLNRLLIALCDDGTMWGTRIIGEAEVTWKQVTSVPGSEDSRDA